MAYQSFENLEVWKRSCRLSVAVMNHIKAISNYPLKDQMTRSSISISSNIAEGQERDSNGDYIRFLRIAKGSCAELRTQRYLASETSIPPSEAAKIHIQETKEISKMLQGLIRSLQPA